jgi:hypothetical protein
MGRFYGDSVQIHAFGKSSETSPTRNSIAGTIGADNRQPSASPCRWFESAPDLGRLDSDWLDSQVVSFCVKEPCCSCAMRLTAEAFLCRVGVVQQQLSPWASKLTDSQLRQPF